MISDKEKLASCSWEKVKLALSDWVVKYTKKTNIKHCASNTDHFLVLKILLVMATFLHMKDGSAGGCCQMETAQCRMIWAESLLISSGMLSTVRKKLHYHLLLFQRAQILRDREDTEWDGIITFLFLISLNTNKEQLQCISLVLRFSCKHRGRAKLCHQSFCFIDTSVFCALKTAVGDKGNELYKIWRRTWPTGCLF